MIKLIPILLFLSSTICFGQLDSRIIQIRELYRDYNQNLSNMDSYEIKLNTAGLYPSMTIYTGADDKVLIKTEDADEFGSGFTEYYFLDDEIQFIFSKSEKLLTHWSADVVRYEMLELRFYFKNGRVIKTLRKRFEGIEGQDNRADFSSMPNKTIDYRREPDSNWSYYKEKIPALIDLYYDLERVF